MSATVDYNALAKQFGGTTAAPPVDYTALAKQHGAVNSTPPPAASSDNTVMSGLLGPLAHPIDTAKAAIAGARETGKELKEHPFLTSLKLLGSLNEMAAPFSAERMAKQMTGGTPGNEIFHAIQGAQGPVPLVPTGDIAESSAQGETRKAIGQAAGSVLGAVTMLPEEAAAGPVITKGIAPGSGKVSEWLEKTVSKFPASAGPLTKAYAQNEALLRSTLADSVKGAVDRLGGTVSDLDPDEVAKNFKLGSNALATQAKAAYKPADEWIKANEGKVLNALIKSVPPEATGFLTDEIYSNPINGLKASIVKLYSQGESLVQRGQGARATSFFQSADALQGYLTDLRAKLPPDVQQAFAQGDKLWSNKMAMQDIHDVLAKPGIVVGAPPSAQSTLTKTVPSKIRGAELLREATSGDTASRFQQLFGPEGTKSITDLSDIVGKQQALSGQGGSGMGGLMMGAGMILTALRGGPAGAVGPLVGLNVIARAMTSPNTRTMVSNLLRANTPAAATIWAGRIAQIMQQEGNLPPYMKVDQTKQMVAPTAGPPVTVNGGASIGDMLKAKGIQLPQATQVSPGLPFHPGAGVSR